MIASVICAIVAFCGQAAVAGHCIYDSIPLDGEWEMAYRTNAWVSTERPAFSGRKVPAAVPGFWEDMGPAFRRAGIEDAFAVNPL